MRGLLTSPADTLLAPEEGGLTPTFSYADHQSFLLTSSQSSPSPSHANAPGGAATDNTNKALLQTLLLVGSALSVAGSFFIILSYFLFKDSRKFSRKILLYLSFADMMASAAWMLQYIVPEAAGGTGGGVPANNTRTHTLCEVQGYLLQFFYLASYIWTGCFAWHLYQLIDARNRTPRKLETLYHVLSWGIPSLICGYLFFRQRTDLPSMGPTTGRPWCWIESARSDSDQWMQFAFFYGPLLGLFLFNLCIYMWLCRRVRRLMSPLQHKIRRRLLLYLGVFIILTAPGLANRIWQAVDPNHTPNFALLCADSLCGPLQGFGNAVVYGLNKRLRERYHRLCCRRCLGRDEEYSEAPQGGGSEALRPGVEGYHSLAPNGGQSSQYGT